MYKGIIDKTIINVTLKLKSDKYYETKLFFKMDKYYERKKYLLIITKYSINTFFKVNND